MHRQRSTRPPRTKRMRVTTLASLSLAALLLGACGSSSPSAADQVCSDRAQLNSAISSVTSDLRSGNFSEAKDGLTSVRQAFDALTKSVEQLARDQQQALSPQVNDLRATVSSLASSDSLSSLTAGLSSARSQIQSISHQIGDALHCS
jgi:small-conductance mechanosensitive channel